MCEHHVRHSHHSHCAPAAHRGCCCGPTMVRRFPTREERIARLEEYLHGLEAEAQAVKERIAEIKPAP
jgi:hypothetical protein